MISSYFVTHMSSSNQTHVPTFYKLVSPWSPPIDLEQYAISLYAMKIWMGYFNSDFILNIIFVSCVPLKKMEVLQWSVVSVIQRLNLRAFIKTFICSKFISPFTIFSIYKHFWSILWTEMVYHLGQVIKSIILTTDIQ